VIGNPTWRAIDTPGQEVHNGAEREAYTGAGIGAILGDPALLTRLPQADGKNVDSLSFHFGSQIRCFSRIV